ncbi:MAG TPA: hypothetical protein VE974_06130 [Thermoanaerobaculia bacterium]|nr:hypothetical protein [Thermoanaerobaculia bacterium]
MASLRMHLIGGLLVLSCTQLGAATSDFDRCNTVVTEIKDHYSLYSEKELFTQYQSRLKRVDSSSYSAFASSVQTLGLNLPLAEDLLNLKGTSDQKSSEFQAKYSEFINSTYEQYAHREVLSVRSDTVSAVLAAAWNRCYEIVSTMLLQQQGTFIAADPIGGFDNFLVTVYTRGPVAGEKVTIKAIEPAKFITCYYGHQAVTPGMQFDSTTFDLTCSKDLTMFSPMSVETNVGKSQKINLPSATSKISDLLSDIKALRVEIAKLRLDAANALSEQLTREASLRGDVTALQSRKPGISATVEYGEHAGQVALWEPPNGTPSFSKPMSFTDLRSEVKMVCPPTNPLLAGIRFHANDRYTILCRNMTP